MDMAPEILIIPPRKADLIFMLLARVTIKGANISPRLATVSGIPKPLDLIDAGNISTPITQNKAKLIVRESLVRPTMMNEAN